jgi:hypothetical protein
MEPKYFINLVPVTFDGASYRETVIVRLSRSRCRALVEAAVLACVAIGSLYATMRIGLAPRDPTDGIAVIFAPWTDARAALTRAVEAGGRFVRYGGYDFIVIIIPEAPDYVSRINAAGALFVVDPGALAACLKAFADLAPNQTQVK